MLRNLYFIDVKDAHEAAKSASSSKPKIDEFERQLIQKKEQEQRDKENQEKEMKNKEALLKREQEKKEKELQEKERKEKERKDKEAQKEQERKDKERKEQERKEKEKKDKELQDRKDKEQREVEKKEKLQADEKEKQMLREKKEKESKEKENSEGFEEENKSDLSEDEKNRKGKRTRANRDQKESPKANKAKTQEEEPGTQSKAPVDVKMERDVPKKMPVEPISDFQRILGQLENNIVARVEESVQKQMKDLYLRLESERKEREKLEQQRTEKLLNAISHTLNQKMAQTMEAVVHKELENFIVPSIGKILVQTLENSLLKPLQESFKKMMVSEIAPKLENMVKETVPKGYSKQLAQDTAKQVSVLMKQPVQESFLQYFQDMLIPAFERSCQVMFRQINETVERGLLEGKGGMAVESGSRGDALTEQMRLAVQTLMEVTTSMSRVIVETQSKILSDYVERGNVPPSPKTESLSDTQRDLGKLIKENKIDEAFSTALSAKNIGLLTWLCSRFDPSNLFVDQCPLSQYVLLSLIQQLGFDLTKDTALKQQWLREACLVLNPRDSVISQHAPPVLSKLLKNLENQYAKSDPSNASELKLLMHIVNSLLK